MKRLHRLLIVLASVSLVWGADRIAFTTKVSGQVNLVNLEKQTLPLKRGTVLNDGDRIETLSDGTTIIMFIDDRSLLRIQNNTTLNIGGKRTGTAIDKQVDMQFGKLRAEVAAQRDGNFTISTPISVASVKGTDFWVTSDPVLGDIFLGIEGLIEVRNLISGGVIEVGGGQVGTSEPDGSTEVTTYVLLVGELLSVSADVLTMEPAEIGEGDARVSFNGQVALNEQTTYAGPEPEPGVTASVSGTINDDGSITAIQVVMEEPDEAADAGDVPDEIRIQLEDADGNVKEVIIIYQ
ncbi:MAG: FecR domain-containing protein [Candidatus Marinimicrobia bacterium]|nr:FecR domain-containing protein [Candidatus Neomarinimicrobiota bacterium]